MATTSRGTLQHIFETPLPENPTLIESLSLSPWNSIRSITPKPPIEQSSFTEIFGELHFKETPPSLPPTLLPPSPSSSFLISQTLPVRGNYMNSESLQLCTEGLGFESCDDVEDFDGKVSRDDVKVISNAAKPSVLRTRRSNASATIFPPPISSIGQTGRPWVSFKSYRHDGRFVLTEVRIPKQEILQASRQDGRLKLHFVQPEDDLLEEVDDQDEEDEEDDEEEETDHKD